MRPAIAIAGAIACAVPHGGCSVKVGAKNITTTVTCSSDAQCPKKMVCLASVGRCGNREDDCVQSSGAGYDIAPDGALCNGASGNICLNGDCVTPECGDGVQTGSEACDDGNTVREACAYGLQSCLVCDESCQQIAGATSYCGDGIIDGSQGEVCDDNNATADDGCSDTCTVDSGYFCEGEPSDCRFRIYIDADNAGTQDGLSWSTAFATLQDALTFAGTITGKTELWVAEGTYRPDESAGGDTNDRAATFAIPDGMALLGGFAGNETNREQRDHVVYPSILSGNLGTVNAYHVVVILVPNSRVSVDGFTIDAGIADGIGSQLQGGGIQIIGADEVLIANVTISNCFAEDEGAGLHVTETTLTLDNVTFDSNVSEDGGGMGTFFSDVTIIDSSFINNQGTCTACTDAYGGAITFEAGNLVISQSSFDGNVAQQGGAIDVSATRVLIDSVSFTNNTANGAEPKGSAIWFHDALADLVDASFTGNTGIAVFNNQSRLNFDACTFNNNGGAAPATEGGAFKAQSGETTFTDCTFTSNTALRGGALDLTSDAVVTIVGGIFIENSATSDDGGAIHTSSATTVTVGNSIFAGNTSAARGGAVALSGDILTWYNVVFSGNSAATQGGGMFARVDEFTLVNGTFVANTATTGGAIDTDGSGNDSDVFNSILWNNVPDDLAGTGSNTTSSCLFSGGSDPLFVDAAGPDAMVGTADDDLTLGVGSPAIDAGDNSAVPSSVSADAAGQARFVDDPSTVDTGSGSAPLVDLGAYEFQP